MGQEGVGMTAFAPAVDWPRGALTAKQFESRWESPTADAAALSKPKEQAFLFPSKGSIYRIVVTANELPKWVEPTISAFVAVQTLPDNWDSYGGKRVSIDLIIQSLSILERLMEETSPPPSVVPLGDGGLQLEWHRKQQDLEIVFPADNAPQYYYCNRANGSQKEGFANDVMSLVKLLRIIA